MTRRTEIHVLQGRPLRLIVRRSLRARHLRLVVSRQQGAEVVMPRWATRRDVAELLQSAGDWLADQVTREDVWEGPRRLSWASGSELPLLGRRRRLDLQPLPAGAVRARVAVLDDRLLMHLAPGDVLDPRAALERWLRRYAADHLRERTSALAAVTGLGPRRVVIGERTSRWGSCSARGTVSFCYRLVMAPVAVVDAVVIHELCHLAHLDHGPRWRALVLRHCPDHDRQMAWLREHGGELEL